MPTAFKAKRLRTKPWHNPYTEKEAIIREKFLAYEALWTGKEDRPGWKDLREEVISFQRHHATSVAQHSIPAQWRSITCYHAHGSKTTWRLIV